MKLTEEQIHAITCGVENIAYINGAYHFYRYTEKQMEALRLARPDVAKRMLTTAGIRMSFVTDATKLQFSVFADSNYKDRCYFYDVLENDRLCHHIPVPNCRWHTVEVDLSAGEKQVEIYFPWACPVQLLDMELTEGATLLPSKRNKKLITYGDSITQGYYAEYPSQSYAQRLARALDAELLNKGFGGGCFLPEVVAGASDEQADVVTVAYGTNDWSSSTFEVFSKNCRGFMQNLRQKYPHSKIFIITPIWRGDGQDGGKMNFPVEKMHDAIAQICEDFPEFTVVCGGDLVPHEQAYFFEDCSLHPIDKGFEIYAENLLKVMNGK